MVNIYNVVISQYNNGWQAVAACFSQRDAVHIKERVIKQIFLEECSHVSMFNEYINLNKLDDMEELISVEFDISINIEACRVLNKNSAFNVNSEVELEF